jgi:hypothetical protein
MPVEIRELVIKATVSAPRPDETPTADATGGDTEDLVALCVEQVLEILRREKER